MEGDLLRYDQIVTLTTEGIYMRSLLSSLATCAFVGALSLPTAAAADIFDGGRLAGGSSQVVPVGSSVIPGELPELGRPVDLERYMGTWYQVAAIPQPYTLQCANNTTAEYRLLDDGTVAVHNSCGTLLGSRSDIEGVATPLSESSLRVNFPGVPFQDPNGPANYRVTWLAEDYSLAVVGSPNRLSGFVLSRTPNLSAEQWGQVKSAIRTAGWNECVFLSVPMAGGGADATPLCLK